jgi:hypothetical protein
MVQSRLRQGGGIALLPAAVFVVHQLRYLLAFGPNAGHELSQQGHGYLTSLTPWIVVLCGLAFGGFLVRLARAWTGQTTSGTSRRFIALWAVSAGGLVALYGMQESLEALFATGHPGGIAGVFGDGGWWAVPAAMAVSLALALLLRGADRVLALVARRRRAPSASPRPTAPVRRPSFVGIAPLAPLAVGGAGRAPPGFAV